jgi:hypothetical protein
MKIYISGALQAASDLAAARQLYAFTATTLRERGYEVYVPHQNTDPEHARHLSPLDVYQHDLSVLIHSDVLVAFLTEPSLGVGAEVAIALEKNLRLLAFAEEGRSVSRFLEGLIFSHRGQIHRFGNRHQLRERLIALMLPLESAA